VFFRLGTGPGARGMHAISNGGVPHLRLDGGKGAEDSEGAALRERGS